MCDPVSMTAAAVGLAVAQQGAQLAGQAKAYNANAANAGASMRLQNAQTNMQTQQREVSASNEAQDTQRQQLQAASTAENSAGESGTSGNSVDALINDYKSSEGRYMNNLSVQQGWNRTQAENTKAGQSAQAQYRINQVAKPDFIGAALKIAGTGMGAYNSNFGKPAASGR